MNNETSFGVVVTKSNGVCVVVSSWLTREQANAAAVEALGPGVEAVEVIDFGYVTFGARVRG